VDFRGPGTNRVSWLYNLVSLPPFSSLISYCTSRSTSLIPTHPSIETYPAHQSIHQLQHSSFQFLFSTRHLIEIVHHNVSVHVIPRGPEAAPERSQTAPGQSISHTAPTTPVLFLAPAIACSHSLGNQRNSRADGRRQKGQDKDRVSPCEAKSNRGRRRDDRYHPLRQMQGQ